MRNTRLALGALALAISLSGCNIPGMEYSAAPLGGVDLDGAGDQIYFDLQNVAGFASGGWVLVLPADWPDRPRIESGNGAHALEVPLEPTWVPFEAAQPAVELKVPWTELVGVRKAVSEDLSHRHVHVGWREFDPDRIMKIAERRAERGESYYYFVETGDEILRTYDVYGAAPRAGAESDALEIVHLVTLEFLDRRSGVEWVINESVNTATSVVALVVLIPTTAIAAGLGVGF